MEQEILKYLNLTYSVDNAIRAQAEEALGHLDSHQNFPTGLISVALNQRVETALRQSSLGLQ
jgi:hypothetical protein